jgi:hypothetical protein
VPENFWDAEKNTFKPEFGQHYNDLAARDAAEQSRKLTLPAKPEDYKVELPKGFTAPDGVTIELKADDPLMAQARGLMHEIDTGKISGQDAFSRMLALHAGAIAGEAQTMKAAGDAEIANLGQAGPARITALNTWLEARGYGALKGTLWTADIVQAYEKLMRDVGSSGPAPGNTGREPPAPPATTREERLYPSMRKAS